MFEKILVALDGSPNAERVLPILAPLLARPTTEVLLARVVPAGPVAKDDAAQAPAREYLRRLEAGLEGKGFRASAHLLVSDDPAAEIVSFAAKSGASLLALATHGRTGLRRLVLGSVAEQILRRTDVPTLLVSPWGKGEPLSFGRVLVPLDGSERAEETLPIALELERQLGSQLVVVHVEDLGALAPQIAVAHEQRQTALLLERVQRGLGREVKTVVRAGIPAEETLAAIEEAEPDVVLMTTHGRTGLARAVFGSVTAAVTKRAPCPVLVLRTAPAVATKRLALRARA